MEAAVRSPRWLSYTTVVFSLSFLLPGLFLIFAPAETILGIYAGFGLEGLSQGGSNALGYRHYRHAESEASASTVPAVPTGEAR